LNDFVTYHLRRAQVTSFNNFASAISDMKITPGQFGVLTLIYSNESISQSAVARALGVERSTMVAVIDILEKRALVKRNPSPTDRRSNALILSEEGRALIEDALEKVIKSEEKTVEALSPEETVQLLSLLRKMNNHSGI
jgi:DNA-binding MarR family transcriptional regulator